MQRSGRMPVPMMAVWLFVLIALMGCGSIRLIAPYDQKTDEAVTNLQKSTAEFFTRIERQGGSSAQDYKNQTKFYDDARVMLSGIIVRANALSKNEQTVKQLEILRQQYQQLEQQNKTIGISQAAVPQLESAFNRTFTAILTLEVAKREAKTEEGGK